MTRISKQLAAALIGVAAFGSTIGDLQACPGGGRPSGGSYYRPRTVVYSQPSYPRVQYQGQVNYPVNQVNPQFAHQGQQPTGFPTQGNQLPPTVRRMNGTGQQQVGFQQGQQPQQQQQQAGGGQFQGQQQGGFQQQSAQASALQALGGGAAQNPNVGQQQGQRPQVAHQQAPAVQQPAQDPMNEVQQSALQALGGMDSEVATGVDPSQGQEAAQPVEQSQVTPSAGHVGRWKATLGNGATVELTLQADGSFSWVATSSGKTSSFQGNYSVEGGALTLVRSSDNQKLAGSLSGTAGGGMNFKLNGAKDAGLNFSRS